MFQELNASHVVVSVICAVPDPGWTDCWGPGSVLGTVLSVCLLLQSFETSSNPPRREHWSQEQTPWEKIK